MAMPMGTPTGSSASSAMTPIGRSLPVRGRSAAMKKISASAPARQGDQYAQRPERNMQHVRLFEGLPELEREPGPREPRPVKNRPARSALKRDIPARTRSGMRSVTRCTAACAPVSDAMTIDAHAAGTMAACASSSAPSSGTRTCRPMTAITSIVITQSSPRRRRRTARHASPGVSPDPCARSVQSGRDGGKARRRR